MLLLTDRPDVFASLKQAFADLDRPFEVRAAPASRAALDSSVDDGPPIGLVLLDGQCLGPELRFPDRPDLNFLGAACVLLLDEPTADQLLSLNHRGVRHFARTTDVNSGRGLTALLELADEAEFELETRTLRTELEKKLIFEFNMSRGLLDSLLVGVLVTRIQEDAHAIVGSNRELEKMLGCKIEGEGLTLAALQTMGADGSVVRELTRNPDAGLSEKEIRTMEILADGQKFIKRVVAPFADNRGRVLGSVWTFLDVTSEVVRGYVDPLTGLLNRRYLKNRLSEEIQRIGRYRGKDLNELAVLMVDIDHFKKINDGHGHPQGDRVLAAVGGIIRACIRDVDIGTRYGGEEFMVILPNTDLPGAMVVADRIRQEIGATHFSPNFAVTASIGVSSDGTVSRMAPAATSSKDTIDSIVEDLILRADRALYRAKEAGRNRVIAWE